MFDIGWSEILVIVTITILVVGPKELPGLLRTVGKTVGNMRRMAGDFQSQFNEALKEAELDEVKNTIGDIKKLNPTNAIKDAVKNEVGSLGDLTDVSSDIKKTGDEINQTLKNTDGASNSAEADLVDDVNLEVAPPVDVPAIGPASTETNQDKVASADDAASQKAE